MSIPQKLRDAEKALNQIIVGKPKQIRLSLVCLLARGHLLLEDLPGAGKTTLAKALAKLLGLDNKRIQFTADMLPSDITGAVIYQPGTQEFKLQRGAIFTNILLADEINRASPKCQSALLEAMEEGQVSIEGKTMPLAAPFFVIATQNPIDQYGTYPLPESQLDRFLFRLSLGYVDEVDEIAILSGQDRRQMLADLKPHISQDELLGYQQSVAAIHISPAIAKYAQALLQATRESDHFLHGLSTRSGLALIRSAQAYAYLQGEQSVYPEHIQSVFPSVAIHRLLPKNSQSNNELLRQEMVQDIIDSVNITL